MTLPIENLDDKIFDDLVRDAVSRIPVYAPGWTDRNLTDPGITFIELFAWLSEMQIYRLNRIDDRSYKKFLKLLGVPGIRPPRTAWADVTFSLLKGDRAFIPKGTRVAAADPLTGENIIFETERGLSVVDVRLDKILTAKNHPPRGEDLLDNTQANKNENIYYLAFGSDPKKDDALYLGFDKSLKGQELTLAFYVYEGVSGAGGDLEEHTSVGLRWEWCKGGDWKKDVNWESLVSSNQDEMSHNVVEDETKNLTSSGKIRIKIGMGETIHKTSIDGSNHFWIRCRIETGSYEMPPRVDRIRLNTISAVQREFVDGIKFSSTGLPGLSLKLDKKPIIPGSLDIGGDWKEVEDLDASGPGDSHYTLDLINGELTFGNGIRGRIPSKGENNITVSYHCGGGVRGNVDAHTICKLVDDDLRDLVRVDNEDSAQGGEDPGTLEEAMAHAKREIKKITRAVTSSDYEHLALNVPGLGVARAKAIPRYHPSHKEEIPYVVSVIVVPRSPKLLSIPSAGFLKAVYRHLDERRLLTTELFVLPPVYVGVSVKATVVKKQEYLQDTVKAKVSERLNKFLHPTKGGPNGEGWPFGRPVYVSEIYEAIGGVEGVDYVKNVSLRKEGAKQAGDLYIPKHGLVYSDTHEITVTEEGSDV